MKQFLITKFGISSSNIQVLHDRAPSHFRRLSLEEQHIFWLHFEKEYLHKENITKKSLITESIDTIHGYQTVKYRQDRPAVLVSSTSWTEDENFDILFNALEIYNEQAEKENGTLPTLLVLITGKLWSQTIMFFLI